MKIRQHRGGFEESMSTVQEIESSLEAVTRLVTSELSPFGVTAPQVHITPYTYDDRNGWNTHIVTVDGYGVFGYTDGAIQSV